MKLSMDLPFKKRARILNNSEAMTVTYGILLYVVYIYNVKTTGTILNNGRAMTFTYGVLLCAVYIDNIKTTELVLGAIS